MAKLHASGSPVYPVLDIYMSPRVNMHRVNREQIPLALYTKTVTSNTSVYNDSPVMNKNHIRPFEPKDGMIYDFKQIAQEPGVGVGNIKILICICMYNEGAGAIQQTLEGIYENLEYFESEGIASEEIAVVCVQDGILKLVRDRNKRNLAMGSNSFVEFYKEMDRSEGKSQCKLANRLNLILDSVESYQRQGMAKDVQKNSDFPPNIEKNISLLYQNLWNPSKTRAVVKKSNYQGQKNFQRNIRLFSAFKHTNGTKLSSHLLFFEGFCRYIKPEFCVLLDVGTVPSKKGLVNLIKGFYYGKNIGGCTGLMSIDSNFESLESDEIEEHKSDNICKRACFSIEKAQEYEYILAHFLDKNAESATGFLHVLPGAWSAYRYEALIKSEKHEANLLERSYFKMILNPDIEIGGFEEANMYLAEDRILSLGIYCQMNSRFTLKYVPDAVAYTDPMKDHQNLMNQRRRWINSSLFAFLYVFDHYYYHVMSSSHNCFRKYVSLNVSMFMALLSFITSYFTPAIYWFILYVTIYQIDVNNAWLRGVAVVTSAVYVLVVLSAIGGSLMGKKWTENAHAVSYVLSVFTLIMYGLVIYNIFFIYIDINSGELDISEFKVISIIVLAIINVVSFIIVVAMHLCTHPKFVCKLLLDQVSYIMWTGAYAQTMVIHGFCNVDDVSWGTKGASGHAAQNKFYLDKFNFIASWYSSIHHSLRLFYNVILAFIFLYIDVVVPQRESSDGGTVLIAIAFYATFIIFLKSSLSIYNHFKWILTEKCCASIQVRPENRAKKVKDYMNRMQKEYINLDKNSQIY